MTTVEDYGKFLAAVMNQEVIDDSLFNEMTTQKLQLKQNKYAGLGWQVFDLDKGEYALVIILPKSK